jgi:WD40 repeat protein
MKFLFRFLFFSALFIIITLEQATCFDGNIKWIKTGLSSNPVSVNYSPDMKYAISGDADGFFKFWDLKDYSLVNIIRPYNSPAYNIFYANDTTHVVIQSNEIKKYNLSDNSSGKSWNIPYGTRYIAYSESKDTLLISVYNTETVDMKNQIFRSYFYIQLWDLKNDTFKTLRKEEVEGYGQSGFIKHALDRVLLLSPDGKTITVSNDSGAVYLMNTDDGKCFNSFRADSGIIYSMFYSFFGNMLFTSNQYGKISAWDISTGKNKGTLQFYNSSAYLVPIGVKTRNYAIIYSNPLQNNKDIVQIWDIENHVLKDTIEIDKSKISKFTFSPASKKLLCISPDNNIFEFDYGKNETGAIIASKLPTIYYVDFKKPIISTVEDGTTVRTWNDENYNMLREFTGNNLNITSMIISPDKKTIATAGNDKTIRTWNIETGDKELVIGRHAQTATTLDFSPDGKYLATGSMDCAINLWEPSTGNFIQTFKDNDPVGILKLLFTKDSKRIIAFENSSTSRIRFWDVESGNKIKNLDANLFFDKIVLHPDNKHFVYPTGDSILKIYELETMTPIDTLFRISNLIKTVDFSTQGDTVLITSELGDIYIIDWKSKKMLNQISQKDFYLGSNLYLGSYFYKNSNLLFILSQRYRIIYNIKNKEILSLINWNMFPVPDYIITKDFKYLVYSLGGLIYLYDIEKAESIRYIVSRGLKIGKISPDNKILAFILSQSDDKLSNFITWNLDNDLLKFYKNFGYPRVDIKYSADSRVIYGIGPSCILALFDKYTGETINEYCDYESKARKFDVSSDEKLVAWSEYQGIMIINNYSFTKYRNFYGFTIDNPIIKFSPDNKYIIENCSKNELSLWDLDSSIVKIKLSGHKNTITSFNFDSTGKNGITTSLDGYIKFWDMNSGFCYDSIYFPSGISNAVLSDDRNFIFAVTIDGCRILYDISKTFHYFAIEQVQNGTPNDGFNIFPNPASDMINIIFNNPIESNIKISICDIYGREIIESNQGNLTIENNKFGINIGNFVNGTYLIKLYINNNIITKKFIIYK